MKDLKRTLIKEAKERFESIGQWAELGAYDTAQHYKSGVEAIVEVLEAFECGSCGGFGEKKVKGKMLYQVDLPQYQTLEGRIKWLEL